MNNDRSIWIRQDLRGHGYSSCKCYEDEVLYISRGGLNSPIFAQEKGSPRLIFIEFLQLAGSHTGGCR